MASRHMASRHSGESHSKVDFLPHFTKKGREGKRCVRVLAVIARAAVRRRAGGGRPIEQRHLAALSVH